MAVVFPYVKNTAWVDGSGGGTPITAAKLNVYEDGLFNAHQQPAVRVTHNTTQSISSSTETSVAFNTELFDQAGGSASTQHDTVTNNTRLTCRYAGVYWISANAEWSTNINANIYLALRLNAATYLGKAQHLSAYFKTMHISAIYQLAVNDYVEARVYQDTGSSQTLAAESSAVPCGFMMVRVA